MTKPTTDGFAARSLNVAGVGRFAKGDEVTLPSGQFDEFEALGMVERTPVSPDKPKKPKQAKPRRTRKPPKAAQADKSAPPPPAETGEGGAGEGNVGDAAAD